MRILILANNDVGLYKFRKMLIQKLLDNHKVMISLPYGELVQPLINAGCEFIDTQIDRRGVNPITDVKLLLDYMWILKKEKPSLVITYTIKPNIYGGLACRFFKIPYAINITGLGTAFQKDGLIRKIVVALYKIACKNAKVVFFENKENAFLFEREKIVRKKQVCQLNGAGVDLEEYSVMDYPQGKKIKFLFIGRVMKEKGINELFQAMKRLVADGVDCELDVVGGYEEDYKDMMEDCEKVGWLHYHGYQKDVRPFIKQCHCFVLPSWHEGMANTNLECAASGRPIITSNIAGCKEAVVEGKSGFLVECKNIDSLYLAMKQFVELSYTERKEMGNFGRRYMESNFDKRKVVEKTLSNI